MDRKMSQELDRYITGNWGEDAFERSPYSNRGSTYYSEVGSYRGALKIKGKWVSAKDLNRISKIGMSRWQGPPSRAIQKAMKEIPVRADVLLPNRTVLKEKPEALLSNKDQLAEISRRLSILLVKEDIQFRLSKESYNELVEIRNKVEKMMMD